MIIAILVVLGLCFGSFINALIWRLHEQAKNTRHTEHVSVTRVLAAAVAFVNGVPKHVRHDAKKKKDPLSIVQGRSMCPHCKHELAPKDLIPVLSWISLRGKCRYCHKPIPDSPLIELLLPLLFVASYIWWPVAFSGSQTAIFALWLMLLIGLVALLVYDLRWMLLPDRIVFPLTAVAAVMALVRIVSSSYVPGALLNTVIAVLLGGGLFYVIYQVSAGKWIGGGDVKLGWMLGLIAGTPARSLLLLFLAALLGSLVSLPLLAMKRLKGSSQIPFGPFLIIATMIIMLFGASILAWYNRVFLFS